MDFSFQMVWKQQRVLYPRQAVLAVEGSASLRAPGHLPVADTAPARHLVVPDTAEPGVVFDDDGRVLHGALRPVGLCVDGQQLCPADVRLLRVTFFRGLFIGFGTFFR